MLSFLTPRPSMYFENEFNHYLCEIDVQTLELYPDLFTEMGLIEKKNDECILIEDESSASSEDSLSIEILSEPVVITPSKKRKYINLVTDSDNEEPLESPIKKLKLPSKNVASLPQAYPQLTGIFKERGIQTSQRKKILGRLDNQNRIFTCTNEYSEVDQEIEKIITNCYGGGVNQKRNKFPPLFTCEQIISKLNFIDNKTKEIALSFFNKAMNKNEIKNIVTRMFDILCHEYVINDDVETINQYINQYATLDPNQSKSMLRHSRTRIIDNLMHKMKFILEELKLCRNIKKQLQ